MSTIITDKLAANPFPGLRPFQIDESHLFFGREGQSDEVLLKLSKSRFVGVIGPSGAGKSSFIYCGVLPILYGGFLTEASPNWEVVVSRPGGGPIDNLAEALIKNNPEYISADAEEKKIKRTIFSTLLRSSSLGLVEAIQQLRRASDINYLVLIDQFEELFRFKDSTDPNSVNESLAFINLLMEAVNYPDSPIYVAITMRSDFIGECAQFPELTRKLNDSHYLIPQMTRDQKRRAIEGPVAVGGAHISPRLTQQLLNDLGDNPDQLPILQHALMRTWSYWAKYRDYEDELLDLKHYEAIGTMAEALSMHANEAYDELDDEQKRVCEILFKAITEKRGENFGIRRPTRLNEIAAIADCSEEDVKAVIEKFREPGRSLLTPGFGIPLQGKSMVDISHESLMRIWVRLKNWVDDEADAVQMYTRLAEAAAMYQLGKSALWRPPDLQLALNWQAKHKPTLVWGQRYNPAFERTMIFLEYSKKEFETEQRIKELEQKRKLQRARLIALVLATATIVSLAFLVYAFIQKTAAEKAEKDAVANAQEAEKQRKQAVTNLEIADRERERAKAEQKKAEEAKALAEIKEKEAIDQRNLAEIARKEAMENEKRAKFEKLRAEEEEKKAQANEREARIAQADALNRRYLAIAKSMAIKSKELESNPEQEALLAQQAYLFNKKYKGYEYDNDIYNGLFYALRTYKDPLTLSLEGHVKGGARALESRKNGKHIYSGGSEGKIIQWSHQEDGWKPTVLVPERNGKEPRLNYSVYSLDISPDEKYLVAGGLYPFDRQNNFAELYTINNLTAPAKKITGFNSEIRDIHFSKDSKGFYARDNSGFSIKYADLASLTAKEVIKPKVKIFSLSYSPDGTKLAGGGADGNLYIWDLTDNNKETVVKVSGNKSFALSAVCFAPDSKTIVVGNFDGAVKLILNGLVIRELTGHTSVIEAIKFNFSGNFMATASKDYTVRLWKYNELTQQPIVLSEHDWVWNLAFTPDDEQLVAGIQQVKESIKGGVSRTDQTIHAWPTKIETMSSILCGKITRNMTPDEWKTYVAEDLKRENTCADLPDGSK
ncbi:MAG: High-affnity carbon uptake protein Hat/HatR [Cyclobacteriaceae bacterium]|jgi:energy-coupling factor transporter ATP-binding protein EcfA2|nr:High-affnity carbon uptake protein Hat/HatR [Flammeovirgaceae bacterium]MCZ8020679.1 High-affnity carbon uptake protein Hat/HatR [Cytophagales bacterium]MCZ8326862.1 High-affnity carbon uptake protein Hat/HatR [Cyclobacteriaceae bacterium]